MTAMMDVCPIFENEEWLVTEEGLEHKTTGYFIERESLGQRREDGLWTWPLHMAEKSWCAMTPFAEAFSCAASIYGASAGPELAQTFKVARREVSAWPHLKTDLKIPTPNMSSALRNDAQTPISLQTAFAEKPLVDDGFRKSDDSWRMRTQTGARPFSTSTRIRSARYTMEKAPAPAWQAPYRIRRTGTKLVRLLQAAWNIR
ncbi:hypothetical protein [Microvirga guangxiensis]|uniref:Uncharacterized protein n=1 Tax=Microvirga guangxiensis TaxID=549386 RepID=A0A1G5KYR3_9HYPH|nr:hypothetical protein [Microvirga guangxiensis]SCZ05311.1 hypothetical protein SAMN02927923_03707 [Microvirga guangxiensis]